MTFGCTRVSYDDLLLNEIVGTRIGLKTVKMNIRINCKNWLSSYAARKERK